ncbi:MAG: hypothetical protein GY832_23505 [Chloroflexi bacterium]|nr:hypothetical protein [Chloroflexota bacterium]
MAEKKKSFVDRLAKITSNFEIAGDHIENAVIGLVGRAGPWAATLPTAYTVFAQAQTHLEMPGWVAAGAGIAIEVLGLSVVNQALRLREYNATKRKSDPQASTFVANGLVVVYFLAAELLVIGLDIGPKLLAGQEIGLTGIAPAVFPLLSLTAAITLALRSTHRVRLNKIAEGKAKTQEKKVSRKLEEAGQTIDILRQDLAQALARADKTDARLAQALAEVERIGESVPQALTTEARRAQLLDIWSQGHSDNFTDLAPTFGVSRQTISNDFAALRKNGKVKKNGEGIEVLV